MLKGKIIISSSKSPYNSPELVVLKKGFNDDDTTKLRLVIDYKHNENTVLIDIQCKILR